MESAPIVRALNTMDKSLEEKMIKKFQVAFTIAREGIAFAKMPTLCDLLERQGVNLGEGYKTNMACSTFVDFIAEDLRLSFCKALQSHKFFSIHMDGSTDTGNVEEEMFLCTYLAVMGLFM